MTTSNNPRAILDALEAGCWGRLATRLLDFRQGASIGCKPVAEALTTLEQCARLRTEFLLWPDETEGVQDPTAALARDPLPCDEEDDPDPNDPQELRFDERI